MTAGIRLGTVDLSGLPVPDALETVSWETQVDELKAKLLARYPDAADVIDDDLEPLLQLLRTFSDREMQLRATWNDKVRKVLLASSTGTTLDHLGAKWNVERLLVQAADPSRGLPLIMESDERFRRRIQLAPAAFGTAGAPEAYIFHALTADSRIIDAVAYNHASGVGITPGKVAVVVLTEEPEADFSAAQAVRSRLAREDIGPMTADISVVSAIRQALNVTGTQYVQFGPSRAPVLAAGRANLEAYFRSRKRIGVKIARSGIDGALHAPGVEYVALQTPLQDVDPGPWAVIVPGDFRVTAEATRG